MKDNMRLTRLSTVPILFVFVATAVRADEAEERAALAKLLPEFESAWNQSDVPKFMSLFHPDFRMKKVYEADRQSKNKLEQGLKKLINEFGEIKASETRKYIPRKSRFVVRVTYAKKGVIPGTFVVKTDKFGEWRIADFNIDGQGERELKE